MARNDFILNVRKAASLLSPQHVHTNGGGGAAVLDRADLWLTADSVADFAPEDFPDLRLNQEIDNFLALTSRVPTTKTHTLRARRHLEKIVELVGESVVTDWQNALEGLYHDFEQWALNQQWETRKETKHLTETMLGTYEVPRLLVHGSIGRLVIDPMARFAAGCDGLVEIAAMPSYDSAKVTRDGTQWFLHSLRPNGEPQPLNEARFLKTIKKLLDAA